MHPLTPLILRWQGEQSLTGLSTAVTHDFGAISTACGRVRVENQDSAIISSRALPNDGAVLGVVCDGIGGMPNGREAATLASSVFTLSFFGSKGVISDRLRSAAFSANGAVARKLGGLSGTTLAAVAVDHDGAVAFVNVGDSRVFAGTRAHAQQISIDDTIGARLAKFRKRNEPSSDDRQLIQYIGMGPDLEPNVAHIPGQVERVLLVTDGAYAIGAEMLLALWQQASDAREITSRTVELSDWLGGFDNATSLVLHVPRTTKWLSRCEDDALRLYSASGSMLVPLPQEIFVKESSAAQKPPKQRKARTTKSTKAPLTEPSADLNFIVEMPAPALISASKDETKSAHSSRSVSLSDPTGHQDTLGLHKEDQGVEKTRDKG